MYSRAYATSQTSAAPVTLLRSGPPVTRKVVLVGGPEYPVGSVLGTITADKRAKLSAAAAGDGSQTPDLILPYTVDATAGDVEAIVYEQADVIGEVLVLGEGHTLASIREGLRDKGITFSV